MVKGSASGVKRVGKGGHQQALNTILPDLSTVIIHKYFLNSLLLRKLSQSSQLQ